MANIEGLATRIRSWVISTFATSAVVSNKANLNGDNINANDFKTALGLNNVTNDAQIPLSQKGAANGVAELDGIGKVPSSQLPSFVDDVLEYANLGSLPATGESGIIYVTQDTNLPYRWSGSAYVQIGNDGIVLGETNTTAYRGDRGKTAYDHSQATGNPHSTNIDDLEITASQWTAFENTLAGV